MGSFLALDFLLFYVCFETALLPVYFFIGIWGGPRRTQTATQFFLYTLLGTVMILLVLIALGRSVYDPVATGIQVGLLMPGEQYSTMHTDRNNTRPGARLRNSLLRHCALSRYEAYD